VPRIWNWIEPFRARVSDDFSPKTMAEFLTHFSALAARGRTWGVYRAEELGGVIWCEPSSPRVCAAGCAFKRSFWGAKTAVPALASASAEMLASFPKVSIAVMRGNKALISALAQVGARREATLRGHTARAGKPIDIVVMAMFRKETR
jgi:RimJ/RimL family protein N-acetyltransferase